MDDRRFQKVAKALADPRRFSILQTIAAIDGREICSGGVCQATNVTQATVSHHLKELTEADLVIPHSAGQFKYFSTNFETIDEYIAELKTRLNVK